jgi:hypothetical protein
MSPATETGGDHSAETDGADEIEVGHVDDHDAGLLVGNVEELPAEFVRFLHTGFSAKGDNGGVALASDLYLESTGVGGDGRVAHSFTLIIRI